jgi:hypothetical protein
MPSGPRLVVAPTWAIRSVTVRTRDGAERLDQVYRRLIADSPRAPPPLAPPMRRDVVGAATPSNSRR